jgi:predicted nuclease with RNAse H fold
MVTPSKNSEMVGNSSSSVKNAFPKTKLVDIDAPVTMEFLSKQKFRNVCHVIWLRLMTVTKMLGNVVSIMISLYCYGYN